MENMEMNEIVTTEATENVMAEMANSSSVKAVVMPTKALKNTVTEVTSSGNMHDVKTKLVFGGMTVVGAVLLWEKVAKPVGRKLSAKIAGKVAAKKAKKAEAVDLDDMDIEDIPDIE